MYAPQHERCGCKHPLLTVQMGQAYPGHLSQPLYILPRNRMLLRRIIRGPAGSIPRCAGKSTRRNIAAMIYGTHLV